MGWWEMIVIPRYESAILSLSVGQIHSTPTGKTSCVKYWKIDMIDWRQVAHRAPIDLSL